MVNRIRFACELKIIMVPLSEILPVKKLRPGINKTAKYRRIAASVREVGIVEPLVVYPQKERCNPVHFTGRAHPAGNPEGDRAGEGQVLGGAG